MKLQKSNVVLWKDSYVDHCNSQGAKAIQLDK